VKGIEPSYTDWKSVVLPLNYTRNTREYIKNLAHLHTRCIMQLSVDEKI
jgi:hypothetical protein